VTNDDRPPLSPDDVAVGDTAPEFVVEDLDRVDIAKYAGASGDFNPIHVDESFATAVGNPSVFGHGMLTAGIASHMVGDWFGLAHVTGFRVRFRARVFPGDTLTTTGEITAVEDDGDGVGVEADIAMENQDGTVVLTGSATATLE
jgi:acyl dehydratase